MKGQEWTYLAVVWVAVWAWVDGAQSKMRSSDPNTILENIGPLLPSIPSDIIFGDPPGLAQDILGPPFDPNDFAAVDSQIAHDPVENPTGEDPILSGGRYQGDIILESKAELISILESGRKGRNMIKDMTRQWPGGVVPYVVSQSYNGIERSIIADAMTEIQTHSCIAFVPKKNHQNYIHIIKGTGCSSGVGMRGSAQAVTLDGACVYKGIVMHELLHALGFWHEHSRYDRDSKIKILLENVDKKMHYNFDKYGSDKIQTLGVPYDLDSLMHYGERAFAKDPSLKTIIPLVSKSQMGQRRQLSHYDKVKLNKLYCGDGSTGSTTGSTTGSIPAPACENSNRDCDKWAMKGECEKNPGYMMDSCCKACKSRCNDLDTNCPSWAKKGECTKNPNYMTSYCTKSCGLCSAGGGGGGGGGVAAGCVDSNTHCNAWKIKNQCAVNPEYMLVQCKKSCGVC